MDASIILVIIFIYGESSQITGKQREKQHKLAQHHEQLDSIHRDGVLLPVSARHVVDDELTQDIRKKHPVALMGGVVAPVELLGRPGDMVVLIRVASQQIDPEGGIGSKSRGAVSKDSDRKFCTGQVRRSSSIVQLDFAKTSRKVQVIQTPPCRWFHLTSGLVLVSCGSALAALARVTAGGLKHPISGAKVTAGLKPSAKSMSSPSLQQLEGMAETLHAASAATGGHCTAQVEPIPRSTTQACPSLATPVMGTDGRHMAALADSCSSNSNIVADAREVKVVQDKGTIGISVTQMVSTYFDTGNMDEDQTA
ncbi:hypothetical protein GGX14DRAFT_400922 [Mycena pura]|uniref:Uncharacterized protein n=1 Tax=Mycena pura TaxID=153505 RepID=A0AAD6V5A9_9AGAR|nr:hypothetical protein GGX14DRAFT_400922 [Mycena pura]